MRQPGILVPLVREIAMKHVGFACLATAVLSLGGPSAAMTQELDDLANSDPEKFSRDQIWVLIRAIKVQSQVLQMYVGQPLLDV